jgi:hypothetical protein
MSFYGAGGAEDAAQAALKRTGLNGWHVYSLDGSRVFLSGPSGVVNAVRLKRLRDNWRRLGGGEIEEYRAGSQCIVLKYEQSEEWKRDWGLL